VPAASKPRLTWTALWFFSIAAGFLLLAIRSHLLGGRLSLTLLRLVIAAGFAILGYYQMRPPAPR
jgi:hypothetical protein